MKLIARLTALSFLFVASTAFLTYKTGPKTETTLCEAVQKIAKILNDEDFDALKGEQRDGDDYEDQFDSKIRIKGFTEQYLWESEDEICFDAELDKRFSGADQLKKELAAIAAQLQKCLGQEPKYLVTKNFIFYTFMIGDVEVELSGNYPGEDRRYINISVVYAL